MKIFRRGAAVTSFLVAALLAPPSLAAGAHDHRSVDGVSIYIGIVPAEIFQGLPRERPESQMHGGPPAGEHAYHLVVALFDEKTGDRIGNAQVKAAVSEIGHPASQRKLEPMLVSGVIAYGNYFDLPGTGPYRIVVHILRPGDALAIEAEFVFMHART